MTLQFTNSDLKQKIDQLLNELWAGGLNNPMTAVEQISYLMFIKSITEWDEQQLKLATLAGKKRESVFDGKLHEYSWRTIARLSGEELFNTLSDAFEHLHELPDLSQTGKLLFKKAHLKIYNKPTLRSVVQIIDSMDYNNTQKYDLDVKGDLYEYLLSKIAVSGTNGQFRTPRHIIKVMVEMLDPQPSDLILDPACGTAGFLIESYNYVMRTHTSKEDLKLGHITGDKLKANQHNFIRTKAINGFDNDAEMIKISIMNLYLHDLSQSNVVNHDPISFPETQKKKYDKILANPPFSGSINPESIQEDIGLDTTKTELLFLKYMYDHLVDGGKCAVIVPEGVLFGSTNAHRKMREIFMDHCHIDAVISLPSGVFKPYSVVKTAVLIYTKGGRTDNVWFYEVSGDGFTLDDNRDPDPTNDNLKSLPTEFIEKKAGKSSWIVSRKEIESNDLILTANRYKPSSSKKVKYNDPKQILDEVNNLDKEIGKELSKLNSKLNND